MSRQQPATTEARSDRNFNPNPTSFPSHLNPRSSCLLFTGTPFLLHDGTTYPAVVRDAKVWVYYDYKENGEVRLTTLTRVSASFNPSFFPPVNRLSRPKSFTIFCSHRRFQHTAVSLLSYRQRIGADLLAEGERRKREYFFFFSREKAVVSWFVCLYPTFLLLFFFFSLLSANRERRRENRGGCDRSYFFQWTAAAGRRLWASAFNESGPLR